MQQIPVGLIRLKSSLLLLILSTFTVQALTADPYSPHANRSYPTNVYWGDTHLHTYLSGDAYSLGARLTPEEAYRFAKGETVNSTGGEEVRLSRPLDFLLVADHAENLGVLPRLVAGDAALLATEDGARFARMLNDLPALRDVIHAPTREEYNKGSSALGYAKGAWNGNYELDENFKRKIWHEVVDAAEKHNDPGKFTTFAGYEYSANPPMLHRNVLFAGSPEQTKQTIPFSRYDSPDAADLWSHLIDYKDRVGGDVISIPHNSNLSQGQMFSPLTYTEGKPITTAYAKIRAELEPLVEVTQIKGDSETHPLISPDDEFADFESWTKPPSGKKKAAKTTGKKPGKTTGKKPDKASYKKTAKTGVNKKGAAKAGGAKSKGKKQSTAGPAPVTDPQAFIAQSHARSALKLGLAHKSKLGVNPFKFGMIGSTDSHTGLATAEENNFWGKMGANEPGPYRAAALGIFGSSGYAAVWAVENTRAAIFAALKRREVYGSTGPRITLRFFGGWDYAADDAESPNLAAIGYRSGIPMGGDLAGAVKGKKPTFLVRAVKDPDGANLDRVQIIKGWQDANGKLHEKVHDVAWSGDRKVQDDGKLKPVKSTVNLLEASYSNSVGEAELSVTWVDNDFQPAEAAFYYVRVIQIPTPRWTTYDAAFYGLKDLPPTLLVETQERAYSSPIWYTP
jgi:hypothetical protein